MCGTRAEMLTDVCSRCKEWSINDSECQAVLSRTRDLHETGMFGPTPGMVKSGKFGQFPRLAGSPPIRIHVAFDGILLLSRTNIWNQDGGQILEFGGAVTVHVSPEHENAGKIVRWFMLLPCVEDTAPMIETRYPEVLEPDEGVTVTVTCWLYAQSSVDRLNDGRGAPLSKYGGTKTSLRYSCGANARASSGSDPETSTLPSSRRTASE